MVIAKETDQSETRLRELGFDPSALPDDAVAKLKSMRGSAGISDAIIAHALGRIATRAAAATLAEMEAGASGATRREIRRALFRLRQRGIEAPVQAASSIPVAAPETATETGLSALLSPIDADGARIAWLIKSRSGGGLKRLWGLVSETEGLFSATLETISRKEFRADRAELERRAGAALIEADWRLTDFILCDAYRRTPEEHRGRVGNFFAIRAEMVAASPPKELRHPAYDEFVAEAQTEPSVELMKQPEIASFKLSAAVIKPYADEATNLQQSVLVLNRMQQEERVNTVVERAIGELLTGDNAHRLRRHLEDTAYYFARTGKKAAAGSAVAAAAKMRDGGDLKRIPFFQILMRAQLGALLAEQQEHAKEEPRLIMTPAEAMRARQAAQARMRQRTR
jgi:hypothetical protein